VFELQQRHDSDAGRRRLRLPARRVTDRTDRRTPGRCFTRSAYYVFLLVEFPLAVLFILLIVKHTFQLETEIEPNKPHSDIILGYNEPNQSRTVCDRLIFSQFPNQPVR